MLPDKLYNFVARISAPIVNVARITTLILLRDFFYFLQQRKFAVREVVIRATFALQLAT